MRSMLLPALAGVGLFATAAHADGDPVGFCQSYMADKTCPVDLVKGRDYLIQAEHDDQTYGVADLVNPAGVATITNIHEGREFRAAYSATYQIRMTQVEDLLVEILTDCKAGAKTQCTLAAGKAKPGRASSFNDKDWYRVNLAKGRAYTATLSAGEATVGLTLLDQGGKQVAFDRGGANHPATIRFKATYTGPYFVQTAGGYEYTVAVK
jgi:hypothetical protein